ncbi:MAG: glycosyltransferase [Desulfovibrio sp.]|uniref:glycosyltransferase n=1 Tax=Desulfovibrio sp. TaxID=885 RepID=UPI00258312F9|nr:glycosyltransferase [Desulfovibrio sp.]MCD7984605.1 glycosyltransferase [Desulfovibrio sp.]
MKAQESKYYPQVNITMPVWNRMDDTLASIMSVAEMTSTPYTLTVVDNGSEADLRRELLDMHARGIIQNVYFLDRNYGVSCACNTGWRLHPASILMKLDNDMEILSKTWMQDIFAMWGKQRYNTLFGPVWHGSEERCRVSSEWGVYWTLPLSLSGAALLVSAKVHESIGYFSEDYGVYGEEDADYCLRCHHAGIRKYTYECADMIRHRGTNDTEYQAHGINKRGAHEANVGNAARQGLFALNLFLYKHGLRPLNVPMRYHVAAVNGHNVEIRENPAYAALYASLLHCQEVLNDASLDEEQKKLRMRQLLVSS